LNAVTGFLIATSSAPTLAASSTILSQYPYRLKTVEARSVPKAERFQL
jgi:hypothetical protein